jgi:hypothetical protein
MILMVSAGARPSKSVSAVRRDEAALDRSTCFHQLGANPSPSLMSCNCFARDRSAMASPTIMGAAAVRQQDYTEAVRKRPPRRGQDI